MLPPDYSANQCDTRTGNAFRQWRIACPDADRNFSAKFIPPIRGIPFKIPASGCARPTVLAYTGKPEFDAIFLYFLVSLIEKGTSAVWEESRKINIQRYSGLSTRNRGMDTRRRFCDIKIAENYLKIARGSKTTSNSFEGHWEMSESIV